MVIVHSLGHYMEFPVERLKFDPDPLGLTADGYECPCPSCRLQRRLAELEGQGLVLQVVTPPASVSQETQPAQVQPMITALDVHGSPERKSPERAAAERELVTADGREVPPWLVRVVHAAACVIAVPLLPVVWLAMWLRRPKLRVFRIEEAA
jgi:TusA-related sulfurtransferase